MTTDPTLAGPPASAEPVASASLPGPTPPAAKRSKVAMGGVTLGVMGLIGGGVFAVGVPAAGVPAAGGLSPPPQAARLVTSASVATRAKRLAFVFTMFPFG